VWWREGAVNDGLKYGLGWPVASTANSHDAIAAVKTALAEGERLAAG